MVGGILVFLLGVTFGGGAVALNQYMVDIRTEKLKRRNDRLLEKIHEDRVEYERSRAYRKGYYEGAKSKESSAKG